MDTIHPILLSLNIEIAIIVQVETAIEIIEQVIEVQVIEVQVHETHITGVHIVDLIDTHEVLAHIEDTNGNIKKSRN